MIGMALRVNTTLTSLDLTDNKIDSVGATEIAEALKHRSTDGSFNRNLKALSLPRNRIGDQGVKALARAMRPSTGSSGRGFGRASSKGESAGSAGIGRIPSDNSTSREDLIEQVQPTFHPPRLMMYQRTNARDLGAVRSPLSVWDSYTLHSIILAQVPEVGAVEGPAYATLTALDLRENGLGSRAMIEIAATIKVSPLNLKSLAHIDRLTSHLRTKITSGPKLMAVLASNPEP